MTEVRVGVVGTGKMGADHVRTLATSVAGANVTAVSDADPDRAAAAVSGLPGLADTRIIADPLELIADPNVDAVLVASGDSTHKEFVKACLTAGKHVLCEKPLTPTPEGGMRLVEAELAIGRRLVSVGFMRRYDPGYEHLARVLGSGAIGAPLMLHCVHRNARSGPGAKTTHLLSGSAVHEIDITRWLLGEEIVRIVVHHGRRSSLAMGEAQDPLFVVMETESGVLVDVEVFVNCRYGYDVRCELVAETGTMTLDQPIGVVRRSEESRSTVVPPDWEDRFADAYRNELRDWIAGVEAREQRGATTWDGYVATEVVASAIRAFESGESSNVELPTPPDLYRTTSG